MAAVLISASLMVADATSAPHQVSAVVQMATPPLQQPVMSSDVALMFRPPRTPALVGAHAQTYHCLCCGWEMDVQIAALLSAASATGLGMPQHDGTACTPGALMYALEDEASILTTTTRTCAKALLMILKQEPGTSVKSQWPGA